MITSREFGRLPGGQTARLYSLTNTNGYLARLTDYGATLTDLHVPDRNGRLGDIVLGFDNLPQYLSNHDYIGATVGRVANRIANGRLMVDGKLHQLDRNAPPHHLHGGTDGFDKRLWQSRSGTDAASGVTFTLVSANGDQGYPGTVEVTLQIELTDDNELIFDYMARTDHPTPVNLSNHTYFNLAGSGTVLGHELEINASRDLPATPDLMPTGEIRPVTGTPQDFTTPVAVGARWSELHGTPRGYDTAFVLGQGTTLAARIVEQHSGRVVEISTTEPTLQLYTANYFDGGSTGKYGVQYTSQSGLALEPGRYPDAVNHPAFPTTILRPGERYHQRTSYRFAVVGTE